MIFYSIKIKYFSCFYRTILYCFFKKQYKRELQEIAFNHSSDIEFMNIYKKCTIIPHSFSDINTTLALDNSSGFRDKLLERI